MAEETQAAVVGSVVVEDAPKPKKAAKAEENTTEFVLWTPAPGFSVREITKEAWASVGVEHETTEWSALNRFRIPKDEFGPKALNILLADDGFEIVE